MLDSRDKMFASDERTVSDVLDEIGRGALDVDTDVLDPGEYVVAVNIAYGAIVPAESAWEVERHGNGFVFYFDGAADVSDLDSWDSDGRGRPLDRGAYVNHVRRIVVE